MYVSISESGTKEHVVQRLRNHQGDPTAQRVAAVLADHVEDKAAPGSVTVSLSGSVSYTQQEGPSS